jgi:hypothetical protein
MGMARAGTAGTRVDRICPTPRVHRRGAVIRHLMQASILCFIVSISLSLLGPLAAEAARVHPLEASETLPNGGAPIAVAVNLATHHFYAASFGGSSSPRVYNFDEEAELDPLHPELTGTLSPEPFRVVVDNSGGAHAGYIYVVGRTSLFDPAGTVQQFDPEGHATGVTITEAAIPANGTAQAGGLPPIVNTGTFQPRTATVDGSGNVYVTDTQAGAIDVFKPTGEFERQIASAVSLELPEGIAIDGSDIYVALNRGDGPAGSVGPGLIELDATTGECVAAGCAAIDPDPILGVAVDEGAGTIFTAGLVSSQNGSEGKFSEYDAATGDLLGVTRPKALHLPVGIAVDEATHSVIVADFLPTGEATVKVFGPEETVPDVTTLAPAAVADHSATLKGEIGAAGLPGVTCVFQYVDQEEFAADGFEGTPGHPAPSVPCELAGPFSGTAMNLVEGKVEGLRGGTPYHERILGESTPGQTGKGSNAGEDIPFTTAGPTIVGTEAAAITETTATLQGTVDPDGSPTIYRFQYLTQAQWEASGWAGATEVPAGGAALGEGTTSVPVEGPISGLVPGTTYRLRILAVSSAGTTEGEEVAFTAQLSPFGGLPDDRAYEQASPVAKNGTDVQGGVDSVQASLAGDRITFFANAGIPGGEGAQNFPTFMATRAPDGSGWSTQGLLPPASYGPRGAILGWTEDLEDTYDFASPPFAEGELLRGPAVSGALTRVGTNPSRTNPFAYAGSSQGGGVALLESERGGVKGTVGPADREGRQNVYAYDRATGQLVVAGVMNDGTVPAEGAIAGPYDWFKSGGSTTGGGAVAGYYTQPTRAISADGSEVFFTAAGSGRLYVRVNPFGTPQELTPAQCRAAANQAACTIEVSAPVGVPDPGTPAAFLGASADGRLVYFLDKGKLTTDATSGSGPDLYRYDVTTGTLTDLSLDTVDKAGARVEGMLGIGGAGGEDAYFVAAGQLAGGTTQAPIGETNLYALHGTTIEFIVRLGTSQGVDGEQLAWTPTSSAAGGNPAPHAARVSADGQTLLLRSAQRLTAYDNHGTAELYLLRRGEAIDCVSCNPSGEAPTGEASVQGIPQLGFAVARHYAIETRNLSADGRRVFFDSPDRLVSGDHNDVNDVYEWEEKGEGSCASTTQDGGCLFLISGGAPGAAPSYFGDASESGDDVFFFTAQPLVAQDTDELIDVYDARVGGGIPSQNEPPPPPPCEGEAGCRAAAASPPPGAPTPRSSGTFPGNPRRPACKKGQVRKHGKCVKKQTHKKNKGKKNSRSKKHKQGKKSRKKTGKGKKGGNR